MWANWRTWNCYGQGREFSATYYGVVAMYIRKFDFDQRKCTEKNRAQVKWMYRFCRSEKLLGVSNYWFHLSRFHQSEEKSFREKRKVYWELEYPGIWRSQECSTHVLFITCTLVEVPIPYLLRRDMGGSRFRSLRSCSFDFNKLPFIFIYLYFLLKI